MGECVLSCNKKLDMLMRSFSFSSLGEIMLLYKSHILGFIEYRTSAIFHAESSELLKIDFIQNRFLDALGISAESAFLEHKLAPLRTRRHIAILGVIHRACLHA